MSAGFREAGIPAGGEAGAGAGMARLTRRSLLLAGVGVVLAACGRSASRASSDSTGATVATSTTATTSPTATPPTGPATYLSSGPRGADGVALTFHGNGDPALAARLLDEVDRLGLPITVFLVGSWIEPNRALVERMLDQGHELGNHTFTHPSLGELDAASVADEIRRCADALRAVTGDQTRWFRPSGIDVPTARILEQAGAAGYPTSVGYDVDPLDYEDPGAVAVAAGVARAVRGGSIVSLHLGHQGTIDALASIAADLADRGLVPRRLDALLAS